MAAGITTTDGAYIYMALENASGQPVIVRCAVDNLAAFTAVYAPGAGTAGNVINVPSNPDLMLFYGNFGSGVQVVRHVVSTGVETNISPTGLTTKVVNCLAVNPSNADEIIITVNTDQDLLWTDDGGVAWVTLNAALGFSATGLAVHWQSEEEYHIIYVAGQVTGVSALRYSPNTGDTLSDFTGATLNATADVSGLELGYATAT